MKFLNVVIAHIEAITSPETSTYKLEETKKMLTRMGRYGNKHGLPYANLLYLAAYRHFVVEDPTFNDINQSILAEWPKDRLPTSQSLIGIRGCSDYIWQRFPLDTNDCLTHFRGKRFRKYIGTDLLHLAAWTLAPPGGN